VFWLKGGQNILLSSYSGLINFRPPRHCGLGAGYIPLRTIVNKKTMRDEGVIYVAGHPLLNRRCTILPRCICLQNDRYYVGWGVKLYSLTHSPFWV